MLPAAQHRPELTTTASISICSTLSPLLYAIPTTIVFLIVPFITMKLLARLVSIASGYKYLFRWVDQTTIGPSLTKSLNQSHFEEAACWAKTKCLVQVLGANKLKYPSCEVFLKAEDTAVACRETPPDKKTARG